MTDILATYSATAKGENARLTTCAPIEIRDSYTGVVFFTQKDKEAASLSLRDGGIELIYRNQLLFFKDGVITQRSLPQHMDTNAL